MGYRKEIIYSGHEPASESICRRVVTIRPADGGAPIWETVVPCDKCDGYVSCVYQGHGCFVAKIIRIAVRPACTTLCGNRVEVFMPSNPHYKKETFVQIIEQIIRDKQKKR
ncbi:hypothetical protein HDR63_00520 [bacterium]|nr:hypothetical protein [bacterium]